MELETGFEQGTVEANGVHFAYLSQGPADGPLALCLHGFPDTAYTWRHLLPQLAAAGYRAVAPYLRGYAPSSVPPDGRYQSGALAADANALHAALGGTGEAVLIGHDWGAIAAYGAASHEPERWRRVVTLAVPPSGALAGGFLRYDQIRRSFYIFFFQSPLAEIAVGAGELDFVARLWEDWSPGYDAAVDLDHVRASIGRPENLAAAIGYYRAMLDPSKQDPSLAAIQAAAAATPPQPTLYLHGEDDGCLGVELVEGAHAMLSSGSEVVVLPDAGHFLHLERPDVVGDRIVSFVAA